MDSDQIELGITISSVILFLSSEVFGKSSCEYNSILDILISVASRLKKKNMLRIQPFRKAPVIIIKIINVV